ncbi:hypothetical protein LTR62_002203 [Meristemomyces frigidus]|uniref:tripeptidyl-peptidase II n=1 Tax=Meristemomyces frigidus TaxID=1508187 RepID=A0AAN7YHR2_9PEZI|nr:hypothetical protein LTR62_002203 [Meristemomyces frigidus]
MYFSIAAVVLAGGAAAVPTSRSLHSRYAVKETHPVPRGWSISAPAPKEHMINLQVGLKQQNQDVLEKHAMEVSDPTHPRYGQHLSAADVHALIAPSDETVQLVKDWLAEHDLSATLSPAKDWLHVSLPVSRVEELLDTEYSIYRHTDGSALVRAPEWSLPEYLHEHIDVVQPTTSFFRTSRQTSDIAPASPGGPPPSWSPAEWHHHYPGPPHMPPGHPWAGPPGGPPGGYPGNGPPAPPPSAANISAICNATFTTLECLRTLYGTIDYVPKVPEKNAIGVTNYLGETQNRSDIQIFLENFRPDAAASGVAYKFPIISVAGGVDDQNPRNATQLGAVGVEGDLDGDLVLGVSWPTKFMSWVTGGSPPIDFDLNTPTNTNEPYLAWLTYVLGRSDNPQVISTSYGDDEQTVPYSYASRVCSGFMALGAQGISVIFSSGDAGVGGNGTCISNKDNTTAMFIPNFPTSCPWVTSVGATAQFQPEVAVKRFGSGAGFSNYFGQPAYQTAAVEGYLAKIGNLYEGLYNRSGRGYPDVAAQGNHDVIVYNGLVRTVGGTSASSPNFAAVIALVNDALIAAGKPALGFLNPWIYGGAYEALTDITSGSSIGCNGSGFPAEVGWDAVTGFGTPNFGKLVAAAFKEEGW